MQYIKKKVFFFLITAFVFYCDVKYLDILWGSSHVCCYLFFGDYGQKWELSFTL